MIYRPGVLAGALSGSIHGVTFVNSRGSRVIRHRPPKLHKKQLTLPFPGTTPRNALQSAIQGWQALDENDRTAWRTLASQVTFPNALGESRSISGYQLYLKSNIPRTIRALGPSNSAPPTERPQAISSIDITASVAGGLDVEIDAPAAGTLRTVLSYGSLRFDGNPNAFFRDFRLMGLPTFTKGVPLDLIVSWTQRFGPLREGTALAIRLIPYTTFTYPGTPTQAAVAVTA